MIEQRIAMPPSLPTPDRGAFAEAIEALGMDTDDFRWETQAARPAQEDARSLVYEPLGFEFAIDGDAGKVRAFPHPQHDFDGDGTTYAAGTFPSLGPDGDMRLFKQWLWRCLIARSLERDATGAFLRRRFGVR